ncbi:peptide-methionine (S)-S-oxide reductase MsrA [Microbulbifer yueqingensis]|uniref:Peptide methionine sulfoxide reductase MsrA n=1 Tax=Microbulbifer yueqingensis TaxID=658219 RepID=A0A1G8XDS5_9GAMM|nr:peptide-methionine (S)-S-oxide reductase MsrA [Microbulbifer yueqingensis]SDJ88769.1 peptide-methionine (S)-S-oxide reductase [Microbulbifer yueqingensis]
MIIRRLLGLILALLLPLGAASPFAEEGTKSIRTAVFAGGCFWCMEPPYDRLDGVVETISGYSGGKVANPTYEQVSSGRTGHAEVVQVRYDASKVSYPQLLEVFWRNVDPFDAGGQFCDRGNQYRSAIFYANEREKKLAEESKRALEQKFGKDIATQIVPAATFYPAEDYHQNYYQRNPIRYKFYRYRCGRDQRLEKVWGGAGR